MGYLVTCRLLIETDCEASAADGVNEILREQQREYAPGSCLIDYSLDAFTPTVIAPDYGEGEAFIGTNIAAAAPAMLAALQWLWNEWCEGGFFDGTESEQIILAAIAAATGEDAATAAAANLSRAALIEAAGEALALAAPTDGERGPGLWRIVQGEPDTPGALYWSNRTGWGGLAGSDGFSDAERETLNLPMGGAWWFDADDHGACASCGAPEGESHGAQCEARGFAMGVAAATGER